MWEAIKGLVAFIGLIGLAIAVLITAWSISIAFRIIAILIAIILVIVFSTYCLMDWLNSKFKK